MRRVFWVGVGATVAVIVVVKGRQVLRRLTPQGVAEDIEGQVTGLFTRASEAVSTFRESAAERERELTESLLGEQDVEEARRIRKERRARKVWDFEEDAHEDEDDESSLGYSFF